MSIRISVCIATYNGEKFLKDQLSSILNQLSVDDEIVISDDGSTDSTLSIIKSFKDKRIKLVENIGVKGPTPNFMNAITMSRGKYIFLADQDDVWIENKVNIMLDYFKINKWQMIISDCVVVNEKLEMLFDSYYYLRGKSDSFYSTLIKANYLGCCMAFERVILEKLLPFPSNTKYAPHDLWIGLIGYKFYKVKKIPEKLIFYRRHENNVSTGGKKSSNSLWFRIKYRIYLLKEINNVKRRK